MLTQEIKRFIIESWRFSRVFKRLLSKLDEEDQRKYQSYYDFYLRSLDDFLNSYGCWIVDMEGYDFDPGMGVVPINLEEFTSDDKLYIEQMLEPTIMSEEGIVSMGKVLLNRRQDWELTLE